MPLTSSFIPSSADVDRYKRLRTLAMDLNHRIVQTIPREAMHQVGEAIGILRRGVLVFESEDESGVLMDCCLYDWIREGKNLVEKYAETHAPSPGTEEAELLQAYLQAKYRIVVPRSRVPGAGASFMDLVSAEELFIMDIGLSRTPLDVAYATRTLPLGQFWMTGGAGLPAGSEAIKKAIDHLSKRRLLDDGKFIDPHKVALVFVRTLLESGASRHIAYETVEPRGRQRSDRELDRVNTQQQTVSAYTPGRNSRCPCGSGNRYKRCCGAKSLSGQRQFTQPY